MQKNKNTRCSLMEFIFINFKVKKQAKLNNGASNQENGYIWLGEVIRSKRKGHFWGASVLFLGLGQMYVHFVKIN